MPLGGKEEVQLTLDIVTDYLVAPTKSGKMPPVGELVKFIKMCKARELDPWVGDAFFLGFDSQSGPAWSIITSIQALLKRAEHSGKFDGLEGGIVVLRNDEVQERNGTLGPLAGEQLLGAWAKCYVQGMRIPFSSSINFTAFNLGRSRWKIDPTGMIVKCAKAAVLREAFPTQLGGLFMSEEMDKVSGGHSEVLEGLTSKLKEAKAKRQSLPQAEAPPAEPEPAPEPEKEVEAESAPTEPESGTGRLLKGSW